MWLPLCSCELPGAENWVTVLRAMQQDLYAFSDGLGMAVDGRSLPTIKAHEAAGALAR